MRAPGRGSVRKEAGLGAYRLIVGVLRLVVRLYFRRVEVSGLDNVPAEGGGVLVAWHPNGLIDPGLVLTHFPRRVVFGARHGLFRWPVLGTLMRRIGTVPIYRAQDAGGDAAARREANQRSLDALAAEVARGSFSCLFPEGTSHDAPHPVEVKTGAARFWYRARQLAPDGPPPVLLPVGLHYNRKRLFRSEAHVVFHPPLVLPAELDVTPDGDDRERIGALTAEIERVLHEVAHATADWETHFLMRRTRKLVRAERAARAGADPGRPRMAERTLGFARVRRGYEACLARDPAHVEDLRRRIGEYHQDLRALGLDDHLLDRAPRLASPALALMLAAQVVFVFFLLPPVLLVGYAVNGPPALALLALTRGVTREKKDEATVKLLVGAVLFPAAWLLAGVLAWWGHVALDATFPNVPDVPWLAALLVSGLGAVGGAVALRYLELVRETIRALRVRLTRRRRWYTIARLLKERAALCEEVLAMAEGLDLPGHVAPDGRVLEA